MTTSPRIRALTFSTCTAFAFLSFMTGAMLMYSFMHSHNMGVLQTTSDAQDRALNTSQEQIITAMRSTINSQEQIITSKSGCIELLEKYAHEKDVEVAKLRDLLVANGAPAWGTPTGDGHILEAK